MKTRYFKGKPLYVDKDILGYLINEIPLNATVADIGCGPQIYSAPLKERGNKVIAIDAWEDVQPDILVDLSTTSIFDVIKEKVDYILMIDFIEHLDKQVGQQLIEDCKRLVNKKIFLLTPLEQIWTDNTENVENDKLWCHGNQFDVHKSLWSVTDFQEWTQITLKGLHDYYTGYWNAE
jgi:hypothetical protein